MSAPTPIADMITEMLKNCIPIEMIISAVRSMERAMSTRHPVDTTAEKRRAWDREYRRNKRAERPPDPPDIHPTPPDVGDISLSLLEKKDSYQQVVSKKERKSVGSKLPPDWKVKQHHYDEGAKRGMRPAAVDDLAVTMRTWAAANANRAVTTKADWDATFMGFIRKENRNGYGNISDRANQATGPAPTRDTAVIAGMGRALERRRAARAADDGGQVPRPDGAAGGTDAKPGTAPDDDGPPRQFTLLAAGYTRC